MYCVNCGVKLADTEKRCPLCGVEAFHPDIVRGKAEPLYPQRMPSPPVRSQVYQIMLTTFFLMAALISLLCDVQLNRGVTWSGFVIGALAVAYTALGLPFWFRNPNPVICIPCFFVSVIVYLLYINGATGGDWFLSFGFPVAGGIGLLITAVAALLKYLKKVKLYIFGGAIVALGAFMPLLELLLSVTFDGIRFVGWSLYPMLVLVLLGGMLIFLAIFSPAREAVERKTFL